MRGQRGRRPQIRRVLIAATAVLVAVASVVVLSAVSRDGSPAQVVRANDSVSHQQTLTLSARHRAVTKRVPAVARSRPVSIAIPALGVSARLVELGLQPDHQVQVPQTTTVAGWFKLGPTPGQEGSSVILGHVDSYTGPGVFFELRNLVAGQLVKVRLADGVIVNFAVVRVVQYSKSNFPDRLVYNPHSPPELQLVTCGGAFDHATGHYLANIVVYTRLLSST